MNLLTWKLGDSIDMLESPVDDPNYITSIGRTGKTRKLRSAYFNKVIEWYHRITNPETIIEAIVGNIFRMPPYIRLGALESFSISRGRSLSRPGELRWTELEFNNFNEYLCFCGTLEDWSTQHNYTNLKELK